MFAQFWIWCSIRAQFFSFLQVCQFKNICKFEEKKFTHVSLTITSWEENEGWRSSKLPTPSTSRSYFTQNMTGGGIGDNR